MHLKLYKINNFGAKSNTNIVRKSNMYTHHQGNFKKGNTLGYTWPINVRKVCVFYLLVKS